MTSSAQSSNSSRGRRALSFGLQFLACLLAAGAIAYAFAARGGASKVVLDNPDGSHAVLDVGAIQGVPLSVMGSGQVEPLSFGPANTLVVFLSGGDCPTCLAERSVWEDLARSHDPSQLKVVGVIVRTSKSEAHTFADAYNLSFPLYLDDEGSLGRLTALPQVTPFKVLIDRSGNVLLAAGPNPDITTHKDFGDKVNAKLESARGGGPAR